MPASSSSTINPASLGVQAGGATTQTTTKRALILKEIQALQKQLTGLYKQLQALAGKSDLGSVEERIRLQQQIDGIEKEIKALQDEMLQKSADEKVQAPADQKPAAAPSTGSAPGDSSGAAAPVAASGALLTVGSVINTQA